MKKFILASVIIGAVVLSVFNLNIKNQNEDYMLWGLHNLKALAQENGGSDSENEWGCGGNSNHTPHETLKVRTCITFWQSKLVCKSYQNVCCDAGKQLPCGGDLPTIPGL